jgi:beta-phosphoglucomutase-like phosphatase (HAD superfamily)
MKTGVLFDMDGTLVESFKTEPLPGVVDVLEKLQARRVPLGVATNQAGPLWRRVTGKGKFPTVVQVVGNIAHIAYNLHLENSLWIISLWDERIVKLVEDEEQFNDIMLSLQSDFLDMLVPIIPNIIVSIDAAYRKPQPGMLLKASELWSIKPNELIYVGDMESDREAAKNASSLYFDASQLNHMYACVRKDN